MMRQALENQSTFSTNGGMTWKNCEAVFAMLEVFIDAYESDRCSVCKESKWKNSFFCRSCCIKLMRVGLHTYRMKVVMSKPKNRKPSEWSHLLREALGFEFDRAHDYLITAPRLKALMPTQNSYSDSPD